MLYVCFYLFIYIYLYSAVFFRVISILLLFTFHLVHYDCWCCCCCRLKPKIQMSNNIAFFMRFKSGQTFLKWIRLVNNTHCYIITWFIFVTLVCCVLYVGGGCWYFVVVVVNGFDFAWNSINSNRNELIRINWHKTLFLYGRFSRTKKTNLQRFPVEYHQLNNHCILINVEPKRNKTNNDHNKTPIEFYQFCVLQFYLFIYLFWLVLINFDFCTIFMVSIFNEWHHTYKLFNGFPCGIGLFLICICVFFSRFSIKKNKHTNEHDMQSCHYLCLGAFCVCVCVCAVSVHQSPNKSKCKEKTSSFFLFGGDWHFEGGN